MSKDLLFGRTGETIKKKKDQFTLQRKKEDCIWEEELIVTT